MSARTHVSFLVAIGLTAISQAQIGIGTPIKWRVLAQGGDSKISDPVTKEISGHNEWERFWAKLTGNPSSTAPQDVDWGSQELVVVSAGSKPAGTTIMVTSITRPEAAMVVVTYLETPSSVQGQTGALVRPFEVIKMDRPAARLTFKKEIGENFGMGFEQGWQGGQPVWDAPPCDWMLYGSDSNSSVQGSAELVIQDQNGFNKYWQAAIGGDTPTDVNWNKEMLLAIHLGPRPRSGYSIYVDRIVPTKTGGLVVYYTERSPGAYLNRQQAPQSPFTILKLPRYSGTVKFRKRTVSLPGIGG